MMAGATMKVDIVSTETIKPSSPTPSDLKTFKFSLIDQIYPSFYIPLILFYTNPHLDVRKRCHLLKASLSKTLTMYYPFAGRIKDHISIECNDEGVTFIETRVNCLLSDVLQNPDPDQLRKFQPFEVESPAKVGTSNLLFVQVNFFECGGMAIGARLVHKIADGTTFTAFIKTWASVALGSDEVVQPELFAGATAFPPVDYELPSNENIITQDESCMCRRFLFTASKIDELKAKIISAGVQQPTRVEAITALIWKSAITASRSIRGTLSRRPSLCLHGVNLRKRLSTPLSEYSSGNILAGITAEFSETKAELQSLVLKLRKQLKELEVMTIEKISDNANKMMEAAGSEKKSGVADVYGFSSWCRMPVYDADFGWGKPTWVSMFNIRIQNIAVLMDAKEGDGIEAWVTLSGEEMALFECNEELLSFASVNPTVMT